MSLKSFREAVEMVIEGMEEDAKGSSEGAGALKMYAKQLRVACKVAGDEPPIQIGYPQTASTSMSFGLMPQAQHALEIEKARSEFRKGKRFGDIEERYTGNMVDVEGGPACPDDVSTAQAVDPAMPIGAYTSLANGVYRLVLDEGKKKLVYDATETARVANLLGDQRKQEDPLPVSYPGCDKDGAFILKPRPPGDNVMQDLVRIVKTGD